jgi:hypothetical protein
MNETFEQKTIWITQTRLVSLKITHWSWKVEIIGKKNKMQFVAENLFKQNVNQLCSFIKRKTSHSTDTFKSATQFVYDVEMAFN